MAFATPGRKQDTRSNKEQIGTTIYSYLQKKKKKIGDQWRASQATKPNCTEEIHDKKSEVSWQARGAYEVKINAGESSVITRVSAFSLVRMCLGIANMCLAVSPSKTFFWLVENLSLAFSRETMHTHTQRRGEKERGTHTHRENRKRRRQKRQIQSECVCVPVCVCSVQRGQSWKWSREKREREKERVKSLKGEQRGHL